MKNKILIFGLVTIMASCSSQDSKVNNNILLSNKVEVSYLENLENTTHPSEWLFGLDKQKLFDLAFDQIVNQQKDVYSAGQPYFTENKISVEKIKEFLGWEVGEFNYDELKMILFHEEWYAPNDLTKFTKKVDFWCPIQEWTEDGDELKTYKRKIFNVKPTANKKGEIVAKHIFQEFDISHYDHFPNWNGLDPNKFVNTVFNKIQNGNLKVYDPIYIVDKSTIALSLSKLEEIANDKLSSNDLRQNIASLIFEENWYFDAESLNIYKEVKSIGFVKKYWEDGEHKSKILFFLKL